MSSKEEIRYRYFCILSALISSSNIADEDMKKIKYALIMLEDYLF